jgi:nitrate/nitrite-specific signal transduction histidine kinase
MPNRRPFAEAMSEVLRARLALDAALRSDTSAQQRHHLMRVAREAVSNAADVLRASDADVIVVNFTGRQQ